MSTVGGAVGPGVEKRIHVEWNDIGVFLQNWNRQRPSCPFESTHARGVPDYSPRARVVAQSGRSIAVRSLSAQTRLRGGKLTIFSTMPALVRARILVDGGRSRARVSRMGVILATYVSGGFLASQRAILKNTWVGMCSGTAR